MVQVTRDFDFLPNPGDLFMIDDPSWKSTVDFTVEDRFFDQFGHFSFNVGHDENMIIDADDCQSVVGRLKECGWEVCEYLHEPLPVNHAQPTN